ncbi:hypothetical protein J4232_04950 [Candidatus Woesearchaeota archaeon]|nr:hypothetical protein [Candidatus Woesearchaeota archaeon]
MKKTAVIPLKSFIFFILFIIQLLFLAGCSDTGKSAESDKNFRRGTNGLDFEIHGVLEKMYEGTNFQAIVQLFNKGAYDISEAYVVVTLEKDYMGFGSGSQSLQEVPVKLNGKSVLNPSGDFQFLKYNIQTKNVDKTSQYHNSVVTITACYKYMTYVITEVCIDPHLYDLAPTIKACEVKDLSLGDQGAPVAIEKIEVKMLPSGENYVKPQFIIHIKNKGNGNVINFKEENGGIKNICTQEELQYSNWNLLQLTKIAFSNEKFIYNVNNKGKNTMECVPDPKDKLLRLRDGEATIRCTAVEGIDKQESAYVTQLFIQLDYGYTVSKSEQIRIERQLLY